MVKIVEFKEYAIISPFPEDYLDDGLILYTTEIEAIKRAMNGFTIQSGLTVSSTLDLSVTISGGVIELMTGKITVPETTLTHNYSLTDKIDTIVYDALDQELKIIEGVRLLDYNGTIIPLSTRLYDYQLPIALVKILAETTEIYITRNIQVTTRGHDKILNCKDIIPEFDNNAVLGTKQLRFRELHSNETYVGDLIFMNGWRFTEYDEEGNLMNGLRLLTDKNIEIIRW